MNAARDVNFLEKGRSPQKVHVLAWRNIYLTLNLSFCSKATFLPNIFNSNIKYNIQYKPLTNNHQIKFCIASSSWMLMIIPTQALYLISAPSFTIECSRSQQLRGNVHLPAQLASYFYLTMDIFFWYTPFKSSRMAALRTYKIMWSTGLFFVILPHLNVGLLSDYKICGDSGCESKS